MGVPGREVPFAEIRMGSVELPELPPSTPVRVDPIPFSPASLTLRSLGLMVMFVPFKVLKSTCAAGAPVP